MMMMRKHELRGWEGSVLVCGACDGAPAVFVCKADDASLCAACDTLVHSANPLARRHHRLPIYQDDDNNSTTTTTTNNPNDDPYFLGADVDQYLDLLDYTSAPASDTLVPLHLDFDINSPNTTTNTETVSLSSLDAGVVPQAAISDISTPNQLPNAHIFSSHPPQQQPTQLLQSSMDRHARVMRYRQKKKTRKFDKTIRYASRKAYAETRPRIKGRFVKRNHDHQLPITPDAGYALVPSF